MLDPWCAADKLRSFRPYGSAVRLMRFRKPPAATLVAHLGVDPGPGDVVYQASIQTLQHHAEEGEPEW